MIKIHEKITKWCTHAMEAGVLSFNIVVKHGWFEKQPEAIDRKSLSKGSEK